MKEKMKKFSAWLLAAALAFAGTAAMAADYAAKTEDGTTYASLADALAAVTKDNALTDVSEEAWPTEKQAYYNGSFYATLGDAVIAANKDNAATSALIYVRPNYTGIGTAGDHVFLGTSITIFGNNASVNSPWEPAVETADVGHGEKRLGKAVSHAMYCLHNGAGFWGGRYTSYEVSVELYRCNDVHETLFNNPTTGTGLINIKIEKCSFDRTNGHSSTCPVTTIFPGTVIVKDCEFKNVNTDYPININNKTHGKIDVTVEGCTFDNCGGANKETVRLTGKVADTEVVGLVKDCTFTNPAGALDIIVGNRTATDNKSAVSCTVVNTAANIGVIELGSGADAIKTSKIAKSETPYISGNVAKAPAVAKIGTSEYETLGAAFAAAKSGDTVELLAASYGENDLADIGKLNDKNVTVVGLGMDETELKVVYGGSASDVNGLHFQDLALTINHSGYGMPYTQTLCGTYERVKFNGLIAVDHGTSSFTDCVFTGTTTGDEYILWQYGGVMLVERCTFKASASKGVVKLYCESSYEAQNLVKDCIFLSVTGSKGCAIYASNSNNLENPIYEMNIVGNTIPVGIAEYKASGDGLTVVNPVKDANDKFTSGTFISGNANKETVAGIVGAVLAENCAIVPSGDVWTVGVKITEETIVTTEPQESKVEVPQDVIEDTEVAQKIEQNTKVEGVKLSVTETGAKPAGIVAVVDTAKTQDQAFAAAVETAAEVSVKVEVAVEPTEYDNTADKGKVAFKLTPKATVTVVQDETKLEQVVEVTNDMIDQNQKIAVSIYTGFKPVAITHDDDNGARIEIFEGDQIAYNEVTGVATVLISHFSTLTGFGDAADVPPAKAPAVAKIGETGYDTLAAAFEAAKSGETVVILNGEHDCTADAAFAKLGTKTVTLKGESQSDTILNMGTGNKTGVQTTPGTNLTLEDMTLKFDHSGRTDSPMYHHTFYHPASQTFRNVTIVGQIDIMDDTLFDTCTFTGKVNDKDEYLLWCYGCKAELVNCTFTGTGVKAPIKLYNEGAQCGLEVAKTTFEAVGTYGCAIYSSNDYPNNNVYEITVGESVTVPETAGKGLIRSSSTGLTVINPTKDENGKYTGGTFESEKKTGAEILALTEKYAGEGFAPVVDPETGKVVVEEAPAYIAKVIDLEGKEKGYETLAAAFAAVKANETVELVDNVDLKGEPWTPVVLNGNFDGKGFAISNLVINLPEQNCVGFFSQVSAGKISNVNFVNVDVTGLCNVGAIVGKSCQGASNVTVTGTIKVEAKGGDGEPYTYSRAGVICGGWASGSYVNVVVDGGDQKNSFVKGPIYSAAIDGRYVAGFIGQPDEVSCYENCQVMNLTIEGKWLSAGFCGAGPLDAVCKDCSVKNVYLVGQESGALFGWFEGKENGQTVVENAKINNVTFNSTRDCGTIGAHGIASTVVVKNATIVDVTPAKYNYQVYVTENGDNYHYANVETAIAAVGDNLEALTATSDQIDIPMTYEFYSKGEGLWGIRVKAAPVVRVGTTEYATIAAALADSKGEVEMMLLANAETGIIKLRNDINSEISSLTIDLNGYTLTAVSETAFEFQGTRSIVIKDTKGTGSFIHGYDDNSSCLASMYSDNAYITFEAGTFHLKESGYWYGLINTSSAIRQAHVVIKGGTYDFDPSNMKGSYGGPYNYVPEGYEVVAQGTTPETWTVQEKAAAVAEVFASDGTSVKKCATLAEAFETAAELTGTAENPVVIQLMAGTIEEDEITLPNTIKNVTIKGAADHASILKNTTLAHRTGDKSFDGLTIDGVVFDNGRFMLIDWGAGSIKNLTFTNNIFRNLGDTTNEAAVHLNVNAAGAVSGFTFENNVIDGCTGGQKSGIYGAVKGDTTIRNNTFNNIAFRPICVQIIDTDGVDDNTVVTGNTFSGSSVGRLQIYGTENETTCAPEGTDGGSFIVNNNIFKAITSQQICCWGINTEKVTTDITSNYYDAEDPKMFWNDFNNADSFYISNTDIAANLPHANHDNFNYYTDLTEDGKIDSATLVEVKKAAVAQIVETGKGYPTLQAAVEDAAVGQTVKLLANVEECIVVAEGKDITLDLNGKMIDAKNVPNGSALKNLGKVTVTDSSEEKTGILARKDLGGNNVWYVINNEGEMVIDYANVTNICGTAYDSEHASLIENCGTLTIKDGYFSQPYPVVKNEPTGELTINGGTFTVAGMTVGKEVVQFYGTVEINGGSYDGTIKIEAGVDLAIKGGTFLGSDTVNKDLKRYGADGWYDVITDITSGGMMTHTFVKEIPEAPAAWLVANYAVPSYYCGDVVAANQAVKSWVADGYKSKDESEVLHLAVTPTSPKVIAEGVYHAVYEDGVEVGSAVTPATGIELKTTYDESMGVYTYEAVPSVGACILKPNGEIVNYNVGSGSAVKTASNAATAGDTVKVLQDDANGSSYFASNTNTPLTFDLNGKTVGSTAPSGYKTISVAKPITLTIVDGEGTGTVNQGVYVTVSGGKVVIKGGIYKGTLYTSNDGQIVIQGGTFYKDPTAFVDTENYDVIENATEPKTWTVQAKAVCQIGDVKYPSIAAAVKAAPAGVETTIKVIADHEVGFDVECSVNVVAGQKVVIDLNGHSIDVTATRAGATEFIKNNGQLTICDTAAKVEGHFAGSISFTATNPDTASSPTYGSDVLLNQSGTLIVAGGKLFNKSPNGACYVIDNNSGIGDTFLTVNDGELIATGSSCVRLVDFNTQGTCKNEVVVNGGFLQAKYYSLRLQTAKAPAAKLTINGGEFASSATSYDFAVCTVAGATPSVAIAGGVFNNGLSIKSAQATITGGIYKKTTYDNDNTTEELSSFVAEGYEVAANAEPFTKDDYPWAVAKKAFVPADPETPITVDITPAGKETEKVPVKVSEVAVAEMVEKGIIEKPKEGEKLTAAEVSEGLAKTQANDQTVWQNYVMGVDGTDAKNVIDTIGGKQADKAEEIVVVKTPIEEFNPPRNTGVTVTYRLLKSLDGKTWEIFREGLPTPEFDVDTSKLELGDTLWKIEAVFSAKKN